LINNFINLFFKHGLHNVFDATLTVELKEFACIWYRDQTQNEY